MLMVISPAKTLDFASPSPTSRATAPVLLEQAAELVDTLRDYSPDDLVELMGVSHKLGELNNKRYLDWARPFTKKNAKQALLAFRGDVYTGLDADSFSAADFDFAQQHLRILSGLYGVLRPLDLIQPYRLEMGTRLATARGANLYDYWDNRITKALNRQLVASRAICLLNLASQEYFKAVDTAALVAPVVTPVFKDFKNGKYKIISFFAKRARGAMSAYIIKNQIVEPERIKKFSDDGYVYDSKSSSDSEWVFLRKQS